MNQDDPQVVDKDGNTVHVTETAVVESITPIVIDLGKKSKKQIRRLKEGHGKLMADVSDTVSEVRASLGSQGKEIVPVVIIYKQKQRKSKGGSDLLPPFIPSPFNFFRR